MSWNAVLRPPWTEGNLANWICEATRKRSQDFLANSQHQLLDMEVRSSFQIYPSVAAWVARRNLEDPSSQFTELWVWFLFSCFCFLNWVEGILCSRYYNLKKVASFPSWKSLRVTRDVTSKRMDRHVSQHWRLRKKLTTTTLYCATECWCLWKSSI